MIIRNIYRFITSFANNDYAMEVLYYHIKVALLESNFNLKDVTLLTISEKFLGEKVEIYMNGIYSTQLDSITLLLSIRTLMLNKDLLSTCSKDCLIFKNSNNDPFEWLSYYNIINQNLNDDDFKLLLNFLTELKSINKITADNISIFKTNIKQPIAKNIIKYYQNLADSEDEIVEDVICNNAFAFNSTLSEYTIPKSIKYIGNTAFAFCENLEKLIFTESDIQFGKFPIIECYKLQYIIVPMNAILYYKKHLTYYADIIYPKEGIKDVDIKMKDLSYYSTIITKDSTTEKEKNNHNTITTEDIDLLFSTFNRKSTSYKYFWFLSILSLLKEDCVRSLSYKELSIKMVSLAWPYIYKGVEFGKTDRLKELILYIIANTSLSLEDTSDKVFEYLYSLKSEKIHKKLSTLMLNVPYRFLSPWIKFSTIQEVKTISQSVDLFTPYALYDNSIIIDDNWSDFLITNISELYKRTTDYLINYLKIRNSNLILKTN